MNYKYLRFIQEKSTGLFFNKDYVPDSERERGWLFNEQEVMHAIRARFGGDHGAELVNVLPCSQTEFSRWCGRRGGLVKSLKKTKANRRNAHQPKRKYDKNLTLKESQ